MPGLPFVALRYWQLVLGAAAVSALLVHYEGIPLIRDGRVDRVRDEATAAAEARCQADNLAAENAELKRQIAARERVIAADRQNEAARETVIAGLEERSHAHLEELRRLRAAEDAEDQAAAADPGVRIVYRDRCTGTPDRARRVRDAWGR